MAEDFWNADPLQLIGVGVVGLAVPIFFPALRPQLAALLKAGAKLALEAEFDADEALADAEIASEIYSTAGDFDLLVKFYVEHGTDIGHFVNEKVQTIPGIQDTRTIITFKAF